jgi:putative membrane protein
MMWWDDSGWGWFAMTISMIVFWALAAAVVIMLVRSSRDTGTVGDQADDPEQILRQRFARGEIDTEEYERRREVLRR